MRTGAELPPRTRRIPQARGCNKHAQVNYLRVRGEYTSNKFDSLIAMELPPRTRRILRGKRSLLNPGGTTSAYAENTATPTGGTGGTGTTSAYAENTRLIRSRLT